MIHSTLFDLLRVACAEAGKLDYQCICNDRLLKKSQPQTDRTEER